MMSKVYVPYRICPLGAHCDHQHGLVTGFALDRGVTLEYFITDDGSITMKSADFPGEVSFSLFDSIDIKRGKWGDYLYGSVKVLSEKYVLRKGIAGRVMGSLPIGGLSSSAAVILSYITALCKANDINISSRELIDLSSLCERKYIGLHNGLLDQSCEVLCKKDNLLFLDTKTNDYTLVPVNPKMKDFEIAVIYSGLSRSLINTKFNSRTEECKIASICLKDFEGIELTPMVDSYLRDVEVYIYEKHKDKLSYTMRKRADHFYGEIQRVLRGVKAWEQGQLGLFGDLMFQSGESSILNYETGSPELITLYNIMRATPGIYGGRFSGAGFRGCCIAFVDPYRCEEIVDKITYEYVTKFPDLANMFSVHFCKTDNGVNC